MIHDAVRREIAQTPREAGAGSREAGNTPPGSSEGAVPLPENFSYKGLAPLEEWARRAPEASPPGRTPGHRDCEVERPLHDRDAKRGYRIGF
jgi:hypothetical protein